MFASLQEAKVLVSLVTSHPVHVKCGCVYKSEQHYGVKWRTPCVAFSTKAKHVPLPNLIRYFRRRLTIHCSRMFQAQVLEAGGTCTCRTLVADSESAISALEVLWLLSACCQCTGKAIHGCDQSISWLLLVVACVSTALFDGADSGQMLGHCHIELCL